MAVRFSPLRLPLFLGPLVVAIPGAATPTAIPDLAMPTASVPDPTAQDPAAQDPADPSASAESPQLLSVPKPDLSRVDPQLAGQIEELERLIRQRGVSAGASELANAFGALGHLYTYYELPEPALSCYENARRLQPEDPRWSYYLGFLKNDLGRFEEAAEHFEKVLELTPDDLATRVWLGNVELDRNRLEAAEEHFRHALEIDPDLAAGWYGLGRIEARRGDDRQAVAHFEKTLELQPEADLVYYALGQSLRRLGRIDEAREALSRRGSRKVQFPDPRVTQLSQTSSLSSVELVRSLAADREGFPDLKFLSYTLSQLAGIQGVVEHLERMLAAWPAEGGQEERVQRARLEYALGGLLVHKERPEEAESHLRKALELLPDLLDARIKLANVLARERRFEEAVEQLSRVLAERPDDAAARLKRAAALMGLGRWQPATDDLLELERIDPTNFEVQGRLAATLERLGRPREALEHYRNAARLDPSNERAARARVDAARLLLRANQPRRAIEELERAVELEPGHGEARLTLAGLLVRTERYEEALVHFERLLEHHPDAVPGHLGRATVLLLLERYGPAKAALEESLAASQHPAVALLLARVLTAAPDESVHDGARAERLARRLDEARPSPRSAELRALAAAETGRFADAAEWQRKAVERARQAGQKGLADYFARRIPIYEAGRTWRAGGPGELIVLPNEG